MADVSSQFQTKKPQFNRSLTRSIILVMLLLTIIPVGLIGGITYFRSTSLIKDQTTSQLINTGNAIGHQIDQYAEEKTKAITSVADDNNFLTYIKTISNPDTPADEQVFYRERILDSFDTLINNSQRDSEFDQTFLMNDEGTIILSSNIRWNDINLFDIPSIRQAINANQPVNYLVYDLKELFPEDLIELSVSPVKFDSEKSPVFLVGIARNTLPNQIFETIANYYPNSKAFYQLKNDLLISFNPELNGYELIPLSIDQQTEIKNINPKNIKRRTFSLNNKSYFLYSYPLDGLNTSLLVTLPESIALAQVNSIGPFNLFIFLNLILISGMIVYYGASQIINPLIRLSESANRFAQGEWHHRAKVNRRDEIGLLAYAFNQMVEQLSALYRSLEEKVVARTQQMNTASQIAQLATSAASQDEIINNAVNLITDHFGFHYTGVYLVDKVFNQLNLRGYVNTFKNPSFDESYLDDFFVPLNVNSIIGNVIKNKQSYVSNNVDQEDVFHYKGILIPNSKALVQVPIRVGDEILGVLDIQSDQINVFDTEFVKALEALAGQIGSGIRNLSLLESTQFDLTSTNILYQTTKQISTLTDEEEIIESVYQALDKTNYVSAIFEISPHHLRLVKFSDRKGKKFQTNLSNIAIPLEDQNLNLLEDQLVIISNDLENEVNFKNLFSFLNRRGCISAALLPINKSGKPFKLIALGSRELKEFNNVVLDPFVNLAEVTGNAIEKLIQFNLLETRKNNLEILATLIESIGIEDDLQLIFHSTHKILSSTLGDDINLLFALYNKEQETIEIPYIYENQELLDVAPYPIGEGLTSYVIQNQKPLLLVENVEEKAIKLGSKIIGKIAKSWMGVPLIIQNQTIGAIVIQDSHKENRFTEKDLDLLKSITPSLSIIIHNANQKNELTTSLTQFELDQYLFNALLDNIPDFVTFKDNQGHYIRISDSYADFMQLDRKQFVNKTDNELFGAEIGNKTYLEEQKIINENQEVIGEIEQTSLKGNGKRWIQHYKLPMTSEKGQPIGIFGFSQDITDLKLAEDIAQNRAQQLKTAAEIARDTSGTLELRSFLTNAVNLVRERFGFYHASIFLIDPLGEYAVLEESTGEAGKKMKEAKHKLAVGSQSTVGAATATGKPVVNNDVTASINYYPNPLLPETQAELAIPLIVRNEVIGAIDVQSTEKDAFLEEDIQTLQILADQLATAILTARLFARTEENLSKHRFAHQISRAAATATNTEEAYQNIVNSIHTSMPNYEVSVFVNTNNEYLTLQAVAGNEQELTNRRIAFGKGVIGEVALYKKAVKINDTFNDERYVFLSPNNRSELAVPILFGDRLYGVLNVEAKEAAAFDETDLEIMVTLGANLASTLSVIELIYQINTQAARQRQMFEAANKIRQSPNMQSVLETSVNEISKMLGAYSTKIKVFLPNEKETAQPVSNNGHNGRNGHGDN
ncbi:MAG: hypothetical protein CL609_22725 [Anaerolineaceae bacterium]|nr:hypothetical protein [Anaerolineaceae bacterium]